jgi:EmrB/QacA subfamily drug resistance transporter
VVEKVKASLAKHSENKWVILIILAVAQFMVILDTAIVNVALPTISRKLNFSPNDLQWVVTAYTLAFGGFLLLGGRASDLYGRRKIFIWSVGAFAALSLLCGLSQSQNTLICMRALQGLAAAIMSPAALSIVLSEFSEGKERNTAMGVWGGVAAGGAAAGVLLGGVITQYWGWRYNFFVNVPVGIAVITAAYFMLPKHSGEERVKVKLDLPGATLATVGLISLVYGLSKAPTLTWGSRTVWEYIVAGILLLTLFVINESRVDQPLMPLSIFKSRNVSGGNIAFLVIACSMFAMFFFLTLYVQDILGYSPVKTGLCFLPITFIIGIMSAIVSNIVGKIGYKPPMLLGPLVLSAGMYILAHSLRVGGTYWTAVFPGLATCAVGMGLTFVAGTLAATSGVPKHFSGLASGILNTTQQIGGAIGLGILSAVAYSTIKSDSIARKFPAQADVHGYRSALMVGFYLALAAVVVVAFVVKNHKVDAKEALVVGG